MISPPAELLRKAIPPKAIPPLGWACSVALFYQILLKHLLAWFGVPPVEFPTVALVTLLLVLLGLGGHRTWQKMKGLMK